MHDVGVPRDGVDPRPQRFAAATTSDDLGRTVT